MHLGMLHCNRCGKVWEPKPPIHCTGCKLKASGEVLAECGPFTIRKLGDGLMIEIPDDLPNRPLTFQEAQFLSVALLKASEKAPAIKLPLKRSKNV